MSKKIGKITLHWAEKFRELLKQSSNNAPIAIYRFLEYCDKEEREINKKFFGDRDECRRVKER